MRKLHFLVIVALAVMLGALAAAPASASTDGGTRLRQGDQAKGLSELELAASLDTKTPKAGMALVQAEMSMKHYEKALAAAPPGASQTRLRRLLREAEARQAMGAQPTGPAETIAAGTSAAAIKRAYR